MGSPMTSTGVPSLSVVMTRADVDGPSRMLAPAPSVATMTNPGTGDGDGDAATNGEGDASAPGVSADGARPFPIGVGGESVGGRGSSSTAGAAPPLTAACAPSRGRSDGCVVQAIGSVQIAKTKRTIQVKRTVVRLHATALGVAVAAHGTIRAGARGLCADAGQPRGLRMRMIRTGKWRRRHHLNIVPSAS